MSTNENKTEDKMESKSEDKMESKNEDKTGIVLDDVKKHGYTVVWLLDSKDRKWWYQWCEARGYEHIGFKDPKGPKSQERCEYRCSRCKRWRQEDVDNTYYSCCPGRCPDWYIKCDACDNVLYNQDGHEKDGWNDYHHHNWVTNNAVLIVDSAVTTPATSTTILDGKAFRSQLLDKLGITTEVVKCAATNSRRVSKKPIGRGAM